MDSIFELKRYLSKSDRTLGKFYHADNSFMGYILEDRIRPDGEYIYGETAIPEGTYRMVLSFSNRFQKRMIQLINVRNGKIVFGGRSIDNCGVRIHGGNNINDTLACPLLGASADETSGTVFKCKEVNEQLIIEVDRIDNFSEVLLKITNNF